MTVLVTVRVSSGTIWQPAEEWKCFCNLCAGRKWHDERMTDDCFMRLWEYSALSVLSQVC